MEEQWKTLDTSALKEPIDKISGAIGSVTSGIQTALEIQRAILNILAPFAVDILNAEALAFSALFSLIEETLEKYLKPGARAHLLVVPIRKKPPYNLYTDYMMPQPEDSWVINDTLSDETKAKIQQALERVSHYDNGNPAFAKTVLDATYDERDINAPRYDDDSAIYSVVILVGGKTMISIFEALRAIQRLFGVALRGNRLIPHVMARPPQNLKAVPIIGQNSNNVAVRLSWENPPTLSSLAEYDGLKLRLDEIAIIRSVDDLAIKAQNWSDLFGAEQPAALGEREAFKENVLTTTETFTRVIRQFKYDGIKNTYIDQDEDLDKEVPYYYAVAYRYTLIEKSPDKSEDIEYVSNFEEISNVVRVTLREEIPTTRSGPKPDWYSHDNPINLVPELSYYLNLIKNYATSFKSLTQGAATFLKSYIKFIEAEVTRWSDFIGNLNARIARLKDILDIPTTGIYVTEIASDSGGTNFFTQELINRLTDESDPSAPPFFRTGYTAGIVILAGAPNPAEFESTKTLLRLIFGTSPFETAFEKASASIDRLLDTIEEKYFSDNMEITTTQPTLPGVYATFSDNMEPVEADSTEANVPFDP